MRRREVIASLAALSLGPFAARAQAALPVIGYLGAESPMRFASRVRAFRQGLAETGHAEGRTATIEFRWAEGENLRLPALAEDLVRRRVAVIVAPGSVAAALAAKAATKTIPIVFETGADPIAIGLVASLGRPEANVTGVTSLNAEVGRKRLQLMHEVMPASVEYALLVNPANPKNAAATSKDLQSTAHALGLRLQVLEASSEQDLETVFATLSRMRNVGLVIANETFFANRSSEIAALSQRFAVPAIHQSREFAEAGGLMSYGGSVAESHRLAGVYTGRILGGAKPGDLPIQQVTKVEFFVNLKAAKTLGIKVPQSVLMRADQAIE